MLSYLHRVTQQEPDPHTGCLPLYLGICVWRMILYLNYICGDSILGILMSYCLKVTFIFTIMMI